MIESMADINWPRRVKHFPLFQPLQLLFRTSLEWNFPKVSSALVICLCFGKNSFPAEIADEVERHAERYDVLEKEQAQKTHVPHVGDALNGNNGARRSYDHSA